MPCTTTGTTWSLCGHSIYQHQPTCRHPGSRCTKTSTLQPGICPSCTALEYHPSPVPAPLPNSVNANPASPKDHDEVRVKSEPREEKQAAGIAGRGEEAGGSGGRDYFFELHIKQLEEKLEAARIREVENNVEISSLKAQVGMLLERPVGDGYQVSSSGVTRSVVNDTPRRVKEQGYGAVERNKGRGGQGWGSGEEGNGVKSRGFGTSEQVNDKLREVTPEKGGDGKEKYGHIAAISFTASIVSKVQKLKSAIQPSKLEEWFDRQIKYTFECAGEGDFGKMVSGYRDFVDFIGVELKGSKNLEGDIYGVLKECEEFVQQLIDVEELL